MSACTATAAMSVMFRIQDLPSRSIDEPKLSEPRAHAEPAISDTPLGTLEAPEPTPASWFATVERRIQKSLMPREHEADDDGRWVSRGVANSAISYLRNVSDLLPSEPYLYSSGADNLVAECRAASGLLIAIVKDNQAQLVTVLDGYPKAQEPRTVWAQDIDSLRREIKKQLDVVNKGVYGGKVDT